MKINFIPSIIISGILLASCNQTENPNKTHKQNTEKLNHNGLEDYYDQSKKPFYHGVASGDPLTDAVIIWTRVTPDFHKTVNVNYMVSTDREFKEIVKSGKTTTDSTRDYTVKIDITGLQPATFYYYQFEAEGKKSEIGRMKTAPKDSVKNVRLGFASCSNYSWGYFNAYRTMAEDSLDAVVHLGDYIYEHETDVYSHPKLIRKHIPNKELTALTDYRTRYAQYRLDKNLQAVHAAHPFIVIWDDHELANNAYDEGAGNHQPEEGDWKIRQATAKKAYYEWMPVREKSPQHLYRSFTFGNLVRLIMLDTRTEGRSKQAEGIFDSTFTDTSRKMISDEHFNWLTNELNQNETWKVIGNQVLFSRLKVFFSEQGEMYMDGWDGYPRQKRKFWNELCNKKGIVFVTGDFHSSFVIRDDIQLYDCKCYQYASEFVIPSISSANYDEDYGLDSAEKYYELYMKENEHLEKINFLSDGKRKFTECRPFNYYGKHLLYSNLTDHGYFVLELNEKNGKGIFRFAENILDEKNKNYKDIVFDLTPVSVTEK